MQLTTQQTQALKQGELVAVVIDQTECVMLRKDVYDRSQDTFRPEETYAAIEAVLDQEDDPGLESYQIYKR